MAPPIEPGISRYSITDFKFLDGTSLPHTQLAYLDLNPEASRVAVVFTCFRGRLRSTLHYADRALRHYRIIVVALFGNGESSSPSNTAGFAKSIDYQDCVRAQHQFITQHLGLEQIDVLVGFSMGGQCAYHWLVMYPGMVRNAALICSSAQTSQHNYQFLEGPCAALENAVDYADEASRLASKTSPRGLRAFGKAYSAWLTSSEWFRKELYRELGYKTLADWDEDTTGRNYNGWAPDDLLAMVRMWQRGDVGACPPVEGGSLDEALRQIRARVLIMPCQTDQYFDWRASERESRMIKHATLRVIPSEWGHLAGSGVCKQDVDWMNQAIEEFLDGAVEKQN